MAHQEGFLQANGLKVAYQIDGPANGEPVLMITGLGGQMKEGPDALGSELARRGFRAIRFDNRDAGLTTHMTQAGYPPSNAEIARALAAGGPSPLAYSLIDMASDTVGVMDALDIERVHIVGGSMGGMIGSIVAADHAHRVLSFAALITSSGNPDIPYGPAIDKLADTVGKPGSEDEILERKLALFRVLQGSGFRQGDDALRESLRADIRRSNDPAAVARQSAAVVPVADRRSYLRRIRAPTVVIQGSEDPLFPMAHGEDLAANVTDAELVVVSGLGHEVPDRAAPQLVDAIEGNITRARQGATAD